MRCCKFNLSKIIHLMLFYSVAVVSANTIVIPTQQPNIQAGINIAANGDTVLVLPGTYSDSGNFDINFQGKAIVLMSSDGPTVTTIDCDASRDFPRRAFSFKMGETPSTKIIGFTITNCVAWVRGEIVDWLGGAIYCSTSSPTFKECKINNSYAYEGGAVWLVDGAAAIFKDCEFNRNSAEFIGGAVSCADSSAPKFIRCKFESNFSHSGGGIFAANSTVSLLGCLFYGNFALDFGGAVSLANANASFINCTITHNSAGIKGGAVVLSSCNTWFQNSIISFNFNPDGESVYVIKRNDSCGKATFDCSDLYGNEGGDWTGTISGQLGINGNFTSNPEYCDATAADFSLKSISLCAPANSPCGELVGAFDANCVSTHISPVTTASLPEEYNLRQNYPNPFNPETRIEFSLPKPSFVKLDIYNILGERITTLVNEQLSAGNWSTSWDGTHSNGSKVASGIYFYRIETDSFVKSKKMLLLK